MKELTNMHTIIAVFGDSDLLRAAYGNDPMGNEEDIPTITEKVFGAARLAVAMGKSTENLEWDEPIGEVTPRTAKPANNFVKSSEARFAKVCETLKKIFGEGEQYEEAVALARTIRDEARAEVIANA
jgi:hypothetical protein